jgi:TRAP-type mannitol/chloroaromatic compound transport system substrate-binding protein
MKRRDFLIGAATAAAVAGCGRPAEEGAAGPAAKPEQTFDWKMVTTWPPGFPGLGTGAENLARRIEEASGGRITVQVYAAGELVPAFEVFDAVSNRLADMGHGAAYYWKGKIEAAQFFAATPFGMNAQERNGWMYYGGGNELWREAYEPFNVIPAPAGNSGIQMGGWFNKEINSLDDLQGLKMRIPGLGGEVLRRAGGTPVNTPGGEIFTALQTGAIDATEWVGPYNDLAIALYQVASFYYYPGWHEPGTCLEALVNKDSFEALPPDLQALVMMACQSVQTDMLAEFTANNQTALDTLVTEHGVELREFPPDVLKRLKELTFEVIEELAAEDEMVRRVWESQKAFGAKVARWSDVSERAYFRARSI